MVGFHTKAPPLGAMGFHLRTAITDGAAAPLPLVLLQSCLLRADARDLPFSWYQVPSVDHHGPALIEGAAAPPGIGSKGTPIRCKRSSRSWPPPGIVYHAVNKYILVDYWFNLVLGLFQLIIALAKYLILLKFIILNLFVSTLKLLKKLQK